MTIPKTSQKLPENLYDQIRMRCLHAGTNLNVVCKKAGVSRSTVDRWKKKEPNTVRIYRRVLETIESFEKTK